MKIQDFRIVSFQIKRELQLENGQISNQCLIFRCDVYL